MMEKVVGPHRDSLAECKADGPQAVAWTAGGVKGSFTAKGVQEVAYILNVKPCKPTPGKDEERHWLVVVNGGKVVVDFEVREHTLMQVTDVDEDGDSELLLISGDETGETTARMVDIAGGILQPLYDFGTVSKGKCEGGAKDVMRAAVRYRVKPAGTEFQIDRKQKPLRIEGLPTTIPSATSSSAKWLATLPEPQPPCGPRRRKTRNSASGPAREPPPCPLHRRAPQPR